MLPENIVKILNEQINYEMYSAHVYQQMASWADYNGYPGAAKFLMQQAHEEREHMQKIFDYVLYMGHMAELGSIQDVPVKFDSFKTMFELAAKQERFITEKIQSIAHEALTNRDYSTFEFIQWFIVEQREEENLFKSILDRFELLKEEKNADYFIDKELSALQ